MTPEELQALQEKLETLIGLPAEYNALVESTLTILNQDAPAEQRIDLLKQMFNAVQTGIAPTTLQKVMATQIKTKKGNYG